MQQPFSRSEFEAENKELREQLACLQRLLKLQERERQQISHEIHDGFVQYVVAAQMSLESLQAKLKADNSTVPKELNQVHEWMERGLAEARQLIDELGPTFIDQRSLVEAVEFLIGEEERRGLQVSLRCASEIGRLDPMLEQAVLRIIQESLANVRRHARVDRAQIRLSKCDERLRILVRDNGLGFAVGKYPRECFGLRGIDERAKLFSGEARVLSRPGHGTVVDVELPVVCNLSDA